MDKNLLYRKKWPNEIVQFTKEHIKDKELFNYVSDDEFNEYLRDIEKLDATIMELSKKLKYLNMIRDAGDIIELYIETNHMIEENKKY